MDGKKSFRGGQEEQKAFMASIQEQLLQQSYGISYQHAGAYLITDRYGTCEKNVPDHGG